MKASLFLKELKNAGIDVVTGVPDSTLKQLCDAINIDGGKLFKHYTAANEGAATGLAAGSYLATGKPACVYMQNSGEGNIINPLASIANDEVYGIPMLFLIGWRGEPGVKDEPQHVYQGKVTCKLLEVMNVPYSIIDKNTSIDDVKSIFKLAAESFEKHMQYAIVIKKGTFEAEEEYKWENGYSLVREQALKTILEVLYKEAYFVSTTGKISRELYEQSDMIYGGHDRIFMTVGGMGHASMIAYGVAQSDSSKKIVCVDGDGAVMMHMGALAFIGNQSPNNMLHILINNSAHESVGSMPTGYTGHTYADIAKACGYKNVYTVSNEADLIDILEKVKNNNELTMVEVLVSLASRKDLGRPKESAAQNRADFMASYMGKEQ
jgi:phosphonopyruvate decarboxylase